MAGSVPPGSLPPDDIAPESTAFESDRPLKGALSYEAGTLSGWLNAPLEISVYADGEMLWHGPALPDAASGEPNSAPPTGQFGFAIKVPDPDGDTVIKSRFLRVIAAGAGEIPGSPLDAPYGDHLLGYVETINTTAESVMVGGWLIDKRWPLEPVPISIWYSAEFIQTACTGISRPDLGVTGYDAPNGGFSVTFPMPPGFDHRKLQILPGRSAVPLSLTDDASVPPTPPPHAIAAPAVIRAPAPVAQETPTDRVEAYIDQVSREGLVSGWARADSHSGPVDIELWLAGESVGAVTACAFRRDLLEAGVGHGHYGFNCRIRAAGAPLGILDLRLPKSSTIISRFNIEPGLISGKQPKLQTVESLLVPPDIWSMGDVERNLDALALDENLLALGPRRYVSRVYRFLLGRWPGPPEFDFYLQDLSQGIISATDIFRIVATSDERRRSQVTPLSPFDLKFPFLASNRHRELPR